MDGGNTKAHEDDCCFDDNSIELLLLCLDVEEYANDVSCCFAHARAI